MTAHAKSTVFWPATTPAIIALWETCNHCNCMAPSQPPTPSSLTVPSAFYTYFFHHKGVNYIVVDHYSNWPIIIRAREGSRGLIDCLCHTFATFSIPDEIVTDASLEFTTTATCKFLAMRPHHNDLHLSHHLFTKHRLPLLQLLQCRRDQVHYGIGR